jgi:glycosyltransferase involved in cell wall biosynthesis
MTKSNLEETRIIVVLGMHRSGTSAVTKSLELLGANLGIQLHQARFDNPTGFWEDVEVVRINESLLSHYQSSWQLFAEEPMHELSDHPLSEIFEKAVELVRSRAHQYGLWAFKDPRTARFIPFWKHVLSSAGLEPLFVITCRNPLSVAASLAARDELPTAKCAYLWTQHMLPTLRDTVGNRRVIVDYDVFLSDPLAQVCRIATALGLPVPLPTEPAVTAYLENFLRTDLRHTTHTLEDLRNCEDVPKCVGSLYELLLSAARDEISTDALTFNDQIQACEAEFRKFTPALNLLNDRERRIETLKEKMCSLQNEQANNARQSEQELGNRQHLIDTLTAQASLLNREISQANDKIRALQDDEARLTRSLSSQEAIATSLRSTLAASESRTHEETKKNQQLDSRNKELTGEVAQLRSEREALRKQVSNLQGIVRDVTSSKSWKMTAPMRVLMTSTRRALQVVRNAPRRVALWAWHRTPLSRDTKDRLRDLAFSATPFLFRNTNRYLNWERERRIYQASPAARPASYRTVGDGFVPHSTDPRFYATTTRLIAFYLPQFHPIPENDEWWGKGFTEWTNVRPARPNFRGHYQPHVPLDLGYYDLLDGKTQKRQVELAKQYGIGGFCFYMYWFGGKRLLEKPLDNYVADRSLDLPFCVCWANENWCRRWDGLEQELLMSQKHSPEDDIAFISCAAHYLEDPRYIRIHGRPLLIIYRPSLFPNIVETANRWREWCRANGIGEIHLAYTQSFEAADPATYGFDSAIEFPPNNASPPKLSDQVKPLRDNFAATVYDWRYYAKRSEAYVEPPYRLFRSVCPSWDNTARRKEKGTVFLHSSPPEYQVWLENAIHHTQAHRSDPEEHLVFVNAWNEWAEGAHLEPDERYGYAWLTASRFALANTSNEHCRAILLSTHDCHTHGAQIQTLETARACKSIGYSVFVIALQGGRLLDEFAAIGPTINCAAASEAEIDCFIREARRAGASEAITSTIVSGSIIPRLKQHGFKVISLIHELPGVIRQLDQLENGKLICKHADKVVFPADMVCARFRDIFPLDESKVVLRPQGLLRKNPFKGEKPSARREICSQYNIPNDAKIVLSVGFGDNRKGLDLFIEVAARVTQADPKAVFFWVGAVGADFSDKISSAIEDSSLHDKVILPGFCNDPRIFFAAADVYALTSREDPFPNVVAEAIDVDVPVVAFESATGAAQFILENNGELARFEDVDDFAEKTLRLLSQPNITCLNKPHSLRMYILDLLHSLSGVPRVSVVIPNYNYRRYIEGRIKSVVEQTFPIYELIVLDDCSSDDSLKVIREVTGKLDVDSVIIANKRNSGSVFKQWRRGVDIARGDVIWIAEADDLSELTFVSTLISRFQDQSLSLAYCESKMMAPDGTITANNYRSYTSGASTCFAHDYHRTGTQEIIDALSVKNTIPNVSAVLFRSDHLKRVLRLHQAEIEGMKVAGDWLLYLRLLSSGTISFCSHSLNMHRRHTSSVTSSLDKVRHLDEIISMQNLASEIVDVPQHKRQLAELFVEEVRKQFGLPEKAVDLKAPLPELEIQVGNSQTVAK